MTAKPTRRFQVATLLVALAIPSTSFLGSAVVLAANTDGASEQDLALYQRGLSYILAKQNENGSFGIIPGAKAPGEVGLTALALKAMTDAPAAFKTQVKDPAKRACDYLAANQRDDGAVLNDRSGLATYRTAMAIMAWASYDAEAFAERIARARDYLVSTQFHEGHLDVSQDNPYYGGFGYDKTGQKADADMSNTAFALAALVAAGLPEDSPVFERARIIVERCQNRSESNAGFGGIRVRDDGGFFYDPGLSRRHARVEKTEDGTVELASYASITYAGLMSLLHAKVDRDDGRVRAAIGWITKNYTLDENYGLGSRNEPEKGQQGLYYYYYTFAKALDAWGERTIQLPGGESRSWARDLLDALAARQRDDGSWVNVQERWWENDPTLVTLYVLNASGIALRNLPEDG